MKEYVNSRDFYEKCKLLPLKNCAIASDYKKNCRNNTYHCWALSQLGSFRFKDENVEYQYEIWLKAIARVLKTRHPGKLHFFFFFFTKKVTTVICTEGVKPSPDGKMIKPLTFDNLFTPMDVTSHFSTMLEPIMSASFPSSLSIIHFHATTTFALKLGVDLRRPYYVFQNDAGSRLSNTQYWENLVLVVVLVSEFKALLFQVCLFLLLIVIIN